ncbi:KilA-N domain-containing protein [Acinetobacter baumannii]|uniref:KilA-N domain-containing protein n=1 Tax=Acinetobacter baumannii TaxID=470 RepID=UPI003AF90406
MVNNRNILVQNIQISVSTVNNDDFISLTDMVSGFEGGSSLIESWLRNKDTVEFLGVWERINNSNFNSLEFEGIRNQAGSNRFTMSAKRWIDSVNAIGIVAKAGRYGGTYAHKDIAFEFGAWLSPEFKLYLIKEFQRLKEQEAQRDSIEWQVKRELSKINYRIHTDAIQQHLIQTVPQNKGSTDYLVEFNNS